MDLILKYFKEIDGGKLSHFEALGSLYEAWNEKVNVISRKDVQHLYERHILHSLSIAKIITLKPQTRILDVGTGGGFPGIPLAIMFPEVQFDLIDSIGKKIKVVNEIAKTLKLKNVRADHQRVQDNKTKYDFIVSRAVTNLPDFVNIVKGKVEKNGFNNLTNGILYLKGGDFTDELIKLHLNHNIFELSEFFEEIFFETKKLVHIYS